MDSLMPAVLSISRGCSGSSSLGIHQRENANCIGVRELRDLEHQNHSQAREGDLQPDGSPRKVRLDPVAGEGGGYNGPEGKVCGWPFRCW